MVSYNSVFSNLQYYILDKNNIQKYLTINNNNNNNNNAKKINNCKKNIFIPNHKDSLFWCFYIIKNGEFSYEKMPNKNFLVAKQNKIELIKNIRENKEKIKKYKFNSISNIEDNLANQDNLNISTFLTLCAIENINIVFIRKKTYYELIVDDTEKIYIVYEYEKYPPHRYGFEDSTNEKREYIRKNFYNIDSVEKPIKSLTYYKLDDLIVICNKLAIEINNENGKKKTKKDLYESIVQYF